MGCGQSTGSLEFERNIKVTGDIYNPDTRNILTVLDIGDVHYTIDQVSASPSKDLDTVVEIEQLDVPVVDDSGRKYLGDINTILQLASSLDRRNAPKKDPKTGKVIKPKKGEPKAIALYPVEVLN